VAVAPEHPIVETLAAHSDNGAQIREYAAEAARRVGSDRFSAIGRGGAGVASDVRVRHPLTGAEIPVVVADYVLADYGTGVVMGVPAHDQRDLDFAHELGLLVRRVVRPTDGGHTDAVDTGAAFTDDGVLTESAEFDGLASATAREQIARRLASQGRGGPATQYKLHDWLVSRQRYWGSPIPIVHCPDCGEVPVPESDLPVVLPDVIDVAPTGTAQSPLAAIDSFVHTRCPVCDQPAKRETDVFDAFVESSWYFLRYPSFDRNDAPWDPTQIERLLPVDMYAGGREHATRHHLYARFVTRAMRDLGFLPFAEPFTTLRLHGLIIKDGAKMSKSRGNVVNPDEYIDRYGADNLRGYLLFCGPWEEGGDFNDRSLNGISRFNARLWTLLNEPPPSGRGGTDMRPVDRAVHKVGHDIERLKFNTALAELMALTNWLRRVADDMTADEWAHACEALVLLLAPHEPFLAEELWSRLGYDTSVHAEPWPTYDADALAVDSVALPVQVDGRVRATVDAAPDLDEDLAVDLAMLEPAVRQALDGAAARRIVYVPGRVLNLVR
jgi:leucyl-tRNA synthetase